MASKLPELKRYEVAIQRLLPALMLYGWACRLSRDPRPGDIVLLQSAPMSIWHLSFYREDCGDGYHMLESVKTGERCRWGNVGFHVVDREKVGLLDRVEWTDGQFDFDRKFRKAVRRGDFYINIPYIDEWDGDMVGINFRTRFSFDEIITSIARVNWKKITQRELLERLKDGAAAHEATRDATVKPHDAGRGEG